MFDLPPKPLSNLYLLSYGDNGQGIYDYYKSKIEEYKLYQKDRMPFSIKIRKELKLKTNLKI